MQIEILQFSKKWMTRSNALYVYMLYTISSCNVHLYKPCITYYVLILSINFSAFWAFLHFNKCWHFYELYTDLFLVVTIMPSKIIYIYMIMDGKFKWKYFINLFAISQIFHISCNITILARHIKKGKQLLHSNFGRLL